MQRLFVLGDSISIHYGPYLERYLEGCFEYYRKGKEEKEPRDLNVASPTNGGDSGDCLKYLTGSVNLPCDLLLLNCGLHDIKTVKARQVSEEDYDRNLKSIVSLAAGRGVKMIWVSSTPVDDAIHQALCKDFKRYNKDVLLYNEIAQRVMRENNIPVIDLYAFTEKLGGKEIYKDHVHYTENVRMLQAAFIAGQLCAEKSIKHLQSIR